LGLPVSNSIFQDAVQLQGKLRFVAYQAEQSLLLIEKGTCFSRYSVPNNCSFAAGGCSSERILSQLREVIDIAQSYKGLPGLPLMESVHRELKLKEGENQEKRVVEQLEHAIFSSRVDLMTKAVAAAKAAGVSHQAVCRCESVIETIGGLQECLARPDMERLSALLEVATELAIPECVLLYKARVVADGMRGYLRTVSELHSLTKLQLPPTGSGLQVGHIEKIRAVIRLGENISFHEAEFSPWQPSGAVALFQVLQATEVEMHKLATLRQALTMGGWVQAAKGSFAIYQHTQLVSWEQIEECLSDLKTCCTEEGAYLVKWSHIIVAVRKAVKEVGAYPLE